MLMWHQMPLLLYCTQMQFFIYVKSIFWNVSGVVTFLIFFYFVFSFLHHEGTLNICCSSNDFSCEHQEQHFVGKHMMTKYLIISTLFSWFCVFKWEVMSWAVFLDVFLTRTGSHREACMCWKHSKYWCFETMSPF